MLNSKGAYCDIKSPKLVITVTTNSLNVDISVGNIEPTLLIKESITDGPYQPLKSYFKNFLKYSEKSFLVELVLGGIIAVAVIGVWYYNGKIGSNQILSNVGFWVMIFFILIAILLLLHMPQLIITFKNLKTKELIKTAFYITFRYLGVTGVAIVLFLISIFGLVAAPIWFLIGLSGPALLIIKFSEPLFYRLKKIDFERIMRQIDEEEENENVEFMWCANIVEENENE